MASHTPAMVTTYGFAPEADVSAEAVRSMGVSGMRFRLRSPRGVQDIITPALGRHGVHNALAAAAVAICVGLSADDIVAGLGRTLDIPHRSQLRQAGTWTILDDSYNASPDAVLAALDLLGELPGRHIAVLGEMLELGDAAPQEHRRVGVAAAAVADRLVVVGDGAREIAEGALASGLERSQLDVVADRESALQSLLRTLRDGDTILVKASRGAALDLLVDGLVLAGRADEASA
jgi:UDP-N-acetylmuramoyl-tripeptide--D-alanyl-D-alanine ligase